MKEYFDTMSFTPLLSMQSKNTKDKDLKKKLRATITKKHKPYLKLHNHFFFLKQ